MAAGSNTVDIRVVAHDYATKTMNGVGKGLGVIGKGLGAIGAAGSAVQVLGGVAAAGAQLLPIALALPGALGAGAFAMATFKTATAGFSDALNAKDAAAFAEATKEMPAPMRETARAARDIKTAFKEVQKNVQAQFWDGMAKPVKDLGKIYLPILDERMGNVANGMNLMGKNLANSLKSPLVVGAVKKMGDNTANMFYNMTGAAGNFASGLIKLGGIGSSYMPRVGTSIDNVAEKWNNWVNKGSADGSIKRMIDGAITGFKDLGAIIGNIGGSVGAIFRGISSGAGSPLASLRQLTAEVKTFLNSASAQEGLRAFGDMLRTVSDVVRNVFMAAMKELAPIVRDLSPVVAEIASALGETLTGAIQAVGPPLRELAAWLKENKEMVGQVAQAALVAWAAFKGYTILSKVAGGIRGIVTAAGGAGGPHLNGVWAGLAKIAGVVGVGVVANEMDKLNMSIAGGDPEKLGMMESQLHGMVEGFKQLATNPGSVFSEIGQQYDDMVRMFNTGESPMGRFIADMRRAKLESMGWKIDPIEFKVETGPAQSQVDTFIQQIGQVTPMVNINGNTNNAGFALRQILTEIAAGKESVLIDGKPMPAQDALKMVMDMISNSAGEVTINGQTMPAGEALRLLLGNIGSSRADVQVGANTYSAQGTIDNFITMNDGRRINIMVTTTGSGGIASAGRLARGGNSGGGLTWVGERGPEMVRYAAAGGPRGRGGATVVGERGPELVNLPPGSHVTPSGQTRAALAAAGGEGGGGAIGVTFMGALDQAFATAFMRLVRERKIIIAGTG